MFLRSCAGCGFHHCLVRFALFSGFHILSSDFLKLLNLEMSVMHELPGRMIFESVSLAN